MKHKLQIALIISVLLSMFTIDSYAQRVSISTDPLKWATASTNLNIDVSLNAHYTLGFDLSFNPFDQIYGDIKLTHLSLSPEVKYWFKRAQYSHYLGVNILTAIYDIKARDYIAKGEMAAVGITYGYGFLLSKHLSIIPNIGFGYGAFNESGSGAVKFSPTITKLGVSISYIIR